jgi:2-keto-3-deoxy-L-rhamnonate aldolase RhmA
VQQVIKQQVINIPFSGQQIGQGYNSQTGESVGTALDLDSVFEDTAADAQTGSTSFELVETQDSLLESLRVTASVDGRVGLFSGGAKMSFSEDHAVNSHSTYVAGRSFIQNAIRHGKGFRLNEIGACSGTVKT